MSGSRRWSGTRCAASFMKNRLSLTVQYASSASLLPTRQQLRRWVSIAMRQDIRMTLRIVDEKEARELNLAYRGRDYATNVLTFVYDDEGTGDVVVCASVVEREAREQHKELMAHYAHMTIHAVLHLQGYDHETDADAARMEALETGLMVRLHYPDPYLESEAENARARES